MYRAPGRLWWTGSEGALQEAAASAASRTLILSAEPVHHVARVTTVTAAQAEVGGAAYSHVADGTLEGEALAGRALRPAGLAAAVAAVQAELCQRTRTRKSERHFKNRIFYFFI